MTEDAATRLGRIIRERRKALKLTQADIQAAGGPSTATLRLIESGKHTDFRPSTSQPLEKALHWDPGSIRRVLEGGEPLVSGVIRGRSGRTLQQWTGFAGSDQTELEIYRLAHLVMDIRDLVRAQTGPLANALSALLDEATELALKRVAQWRTGAGDEAVDGSALQDARWFVEETRGSGAIRREGDIYVADGSGRDADDAPPALWLAEAARHGNSVGQATRDQQDTDAEAPESPAPYPISSPKRGDTDGGATPQEVAQKLDELVLEMLAGVRDIDPSVDFREQYITARKALEPIIDTPAGQLAHLKLAQQVIGDAGLKIDVSEVAQNYGKFDDA